MSQEFVIYVFREALYTALLVSAPLLVVSLLVGLLISIFQAVCPEAHRHCDRRRAHAPVDDRCDRVVHNRAVQQHSFARALTMEIAVLQFVIGLLVFVRVTSLLVLAPGFGNKAVPPTVKIALGIFLAFVLSPVVSAAHPDVDLRLGSLVVMALKESAVGMAMGFASGLVFEGVRIAGDLMGFDLGLSLAQLYDPENGTSNNVVAQLLSMTALMVFFVLNGHHFILEALYVSYSAVPLGQFHASPALLEGIVTLTGMTLVVGVKLAAPVIVTSFLLNIGMAVLARVAPQINVFFVAVSLKTGAGMFVLMASVPMVVAVFRKLLLGFEDGMLTIVKAM